MTLDTVFDKKDRKKLVIGGIFSCAAGFVFLCGFRNWKFSVFLSKDILNAGIFIAKLAAALAVFCCAWIFVFGAVRILAAGGRLGKKPAFRLFSALFPFGLFMLLFYTWCARNYPVSEPETVFFVLSEPLHGAEKIFLLNMAKFVILPFGIFSALSAIFRRFARTTNFGADDFFAADGIFIFLIGCASFVFGLKIFAYPRLFRESKVPAVFSEFWEENFIQPEIQKIEFPQKKRNLIFIFMESMESSFAGADGRGGGINYIPNLTRLAKENINFRQCARNENFIGGGCDSAGSGWTVAAMTAKLAGIPFNLRAASNPSKLPHFMPKAVSLTDILAANGYKMRFICGSDKGFASRDRLLEEHGGTEIHDLVWYRDNGFLPKNYHNGFWGFEDSYLYEFAKTELDEISESGGPFFFSLLTVDTHAAEGFLCAKCEPEKGEAQIRTVIKCADRQVSDFIDWCKIQPWFPDTTIVITGDHLFMLTGATQNLFDAGDRALVDGLDNRERKILTETSGRRWLDIFINSAKIPDGDAETGRNFTSFDIFPTVLESIGVTIPQDGLAFGRSLFSGKPTLAESYGLDRLNGELKKKIAQFEALAW